MPRPVLHIFLGICGFPKSSKNSVGNFFNAFLDAASDIICFAHPAFMDNETNRTAMIFCMKPLALISAAFEKRQFFIIDCIGYKSGYDLFRKLIGTKII